MSSQVQTQLEQLKKELQELKKSLRRQQEVRREDALAKLATAVATALVGYLLYTGGSALVDKLAKDNKQAKAVGRIALGAVELAGGFFAYKYLNPPLADWAIYSLGISGTMTTLSGFAHLLSKQ